MEVGITDYIQCQAENTTSTSATILGQWIFLKQRWAVHTTYIQDEIYIYIVFVLFAWCNMLPSHFCTRRKINQSDAG